MNKPEMPLNTALEFLRGKDRITTYDKLTIELDLSWKRDGREIAWGCFPDKRHISEVCINETKTFASTSFYGEEAGYFTHLGNYGIDYYINHDGYRFAA